MVSNKCAKPCTASSFNSYGSKVKCEESFLFFLLWKVDSFSHGVLACSFSFELVSQEPWSITHTE